MKSKATISDIARLAEVSKTTVSFYLNGKYSKMSDETRANIKRAIEITNYASDAIVSPQAINQAHLIGVVIGDITSTFANRIVKGLEDYTREKNYQLILGSSEYLLENERHCVDGMIQMGVGGLVVQPSSQFETMWRSLGYDLPIVYFDSKNHDTTGMWVKTNNYEAVFDATEQMIHRGYKRFVIVCADPTNMVTREERIRGFSDPLELNGVPYDVILADRSTTTEELETELAIYLSGKEDVCVFAANNWLLRKTHVAMAPYRNRMPKRLGLYGMDGEEWTGLVTPTVSYIQQPAYEEGRKAAMMLIDRIEDTNAEPPNQILACRFREQGSTQKNER